MILFLQLYTTIWFVFMALVMIAFRKSAFVLNGNGVNHLMAGVFWIVAASTARGFFWDIFPDLIGRETFREYLAVIHPTTWPNAIFYTMKIVAAIRFMYGFWLMLPEEDRHEYNIFTAVFYPKRLRINSRGKANDE